MVKGKNKSFIDRKNAVTFHLVHRSQHDPLVVDETAPQRVLVEATSQNQQPKQNTDDLNSTKRREELQKYGIFFDDDYNYLQHLRKPEQDVVWEYVENPNHSRKCVGEGNTPTGPKLTLPSSVFATEYEEEEGMLNKAAPRPGPRPDWDPDVVSALDDDFDYEKEENLLEDDFVLKAMAEKTDDEDDELCPISDNEASLDSNFESDNDSELMDKLGPLKRRQSFNEEELKSRFTEYSMSSSVKERNQNLTLLDDRFDRFYASYDDPELGDLACEEIEGIWHQKHSVVLACYREHKKGKKIEEYDKNWDSERIERYRNVTEGDKDPNDELVEMEISEMHDKKWDCESVLSTYSNIYNHPKLIEEPSHSRKNKFGTGSGKIEIDSKSSIPINVLRNSDGLTMKAVARLDDETNCSGPKSLCNKSLISTLSVLSIRPKDESYEEKRERKRLLKEYRSERRIEKKANADAFKQEHKRQTHVKVNQICNQQGTKIV